MVITKNGAETMSRIQIQDLPQNSEISAEKMKQVRGGCGVGPLPPVPEFGMSITPPRIMVGGQLRGPISAEAPAPKP